MNGKIQDENVQSMISHLGTICPIRRYDCWVICVPTKDKRRPKNDHHFPSFRPKKEKKGGKEDDDKEEEVSDEEEDDNEPDPDDPGSKPLHRV